MTGIDSSERERLLRLLAARGKKAQEPPPPATRSRPPEGGALRDPWKEHLRTFYDGVTDQLAATDYGNLSFFLNLGYKANDNPQRGVIELPARMLNRNSVKLVVETIGDQDLAGATVVDVGCGRGGTAWTLHRYFGVGSVIGMDLSAGAAGFCRRVHDFDGAHFLAADAERLPFKSECCDAVTNIESACDYPNRPGFYEEVCRILRPGGVFLYADVFMAGHTCQVCYDFFEAAGFVIERHDDVTSNVMASCLEVSNRRLDAFSGTGGETRMKDFMGAPGSVVFNAFEERTATFDIFRVRKPR